MSTKWDKENLERLTATYSRKNKEHLKMLDKIKQEMKEKNYTFSKWLADKLIREEK